MPVRSPQHTTRKVLLAVYATLLTLSLAVILLVHTGEHREQRANALERLGSVTSGLADLINPTHLREVLSKYDGQGMIFKNTQDAWYYVMHDHLRKAAERNGSERPLEVLVYDSLKQELQVVVTSAPTPTYRHPYTGDMAPVMAGYHSGGRLIAKREEATFVAFDPVIDAQGRVLGVVIGTMDEDVAVSRALGSLWRNLVIALVLFVLAGLVLFTSVGRWLEREEAAHDALLAKHTGITDSIAYAGKIQRSLVPPPTTYASLFTGAFVIDRPKDVVSGDFHWVHRVNEHLIYVAAADCTGHGLPGAMMAAIGCSLLNEVVPNHAGKDPAELLTMLNTRLVTTLHQQGRTRGAGDGMDIALCRIDRRRNEILFAGAMRPLYWSHNGQLTVINGDRKPVGGSQHELDRRFTVHRVAYQPGDRIYLFSDGYVDQFGGPEGKRFMSSRLHALLQEHRHLPMELQAAAIEQAFAEWKGDREQMDDVCMLGIAV